MMCNLLLLLCVQVQTKSLSQCVEFYYLWKKKLSLSARTPAGLTVALPDKNVRNTVFIHIKQEQSQMEKIDSSILRSWYEAPEERPCCYQQCDTYWYFSRSNNTTGIYQNKELSSMTHLKICPPNWKHDWFLKLKWLKLEHKPIV